MQSKMLSTHHACNCSCLVISEICFIFYMYMYVTSTMCMENSSVSVVTGEQKWGSDEHACLWSHQCVLGLNSNPVLSECWVCCWFLLSPRVFLRSPVFLLPQKKNVSKFEFNKDRRATWKAWCGFLSKCWKFYSYIMYGGITAMHVSHYVI